MLPEDAVALLKDYRRGQLIRLSMPQAATALIKIGFDAWRAGGQTILGRSQEK